MPAETLSAVVDFCGEAFPVPEHGALTIGREGHIEISDNPYLHRRFLELAFRDEMLWIANVGSSTSVTLSDAEGLLQSWLSPSASMPIVFPRTMLWFTAGPTTYELEIALRGALFVPSAGATGEGSGETTNGRISFTPDQRLLVLALAEPVLRQGNRAAAGIPPSAEAAARLGWTITKFNRKLDNVCAKLARIGVRGLVTDGRYPATNRRARLVEYSVASHLVTAGDLQWLDALDAERTGNGAAQGLAH